MFRLQTWMFRAFAWMVCLFACKQNRFAWMFCVQSLGKNPFPPLMPDVDRANSWVPMSGHSLDATQETVQKSQGDFIHQTGVAPVAHLATMSAHN
jgi:hypothetical protein